ncbi:MAG: protein kinase [Planctomycetes bacterium]|nr:protein kinase [Planctomycetota bacterium]
MNAEDTPTSVSGPLRSNPGEPLSNSDLHSRPQREHGSSGFQFAVAEPVRYPEIGDCIDDCRIVAELGRGASGRAYLARQETLANRPIVLKVTRDFSRHEDLNLARLQHTNIMPLYWASTVPGLGLRVLAMPYLARTTLARLLFRRTKAPGEHWTGTRVFDALEEEQAAMPERIAVHGHAAENLKGISWVKFVVQTGQAVAEALAYAHQRGLVHLDLKPANILITPDGHPLVLDLDVARQPIPEGASLVAWLGGTLMFMSPEQKVAISAISKLEPIPCAVDGRSDLYSLGLVLACALGRTGTDEPPPDPQTLPRLNPDVSPGLVAIIARCLAPKPVDRYPDGDALAEDLRRHLEDLPLHGVRNRLSERWRKWRRRRPMGLALILMLAALCGMAVAVGFGFHQQNEDRRREIETALHDGQERQRLGQHEAAITRYLAGKELAERTCGVEQLKNELNQRLQQLRRLQLAKELDKVVGQMRFYALQDRTPLRLQWVLEGAGRKLWAERALLMDSSAGKLEQAIENDIQTRLQELVILWTDLHVRLAPPAQVEQAHADVREMLTEAERLLGSSLGLNLVHEQQGEKAPGARTQPESAWEFCALARVALNRGDPAEALQFSQAARDREPLGFVPNFYFGVCALRQKQYEQAARAFSFCAGQNPCAECFLLRGQAFAALGDTDQALKDFDLAIERNPEWGVAYQHRGNLHRMLGHTEEAERDLKLARSLSEE